ncbi:hypothetical protein PFISCL1PPCAC_9342, partial [Pristionchus fissidentatus]
LPQQLQQPVVQQPVVVQPVPGQQQPMDDGYSTDEDDDDINQVVVANHQNHNPHAVINPPPHANQAAATPGNLYDTSLAITTVAFLLAA